MLSRSGRRQPIGRSVEPLRPTRIVYQVLIDTSQGYHVWSESFNRELGDVFDIQDEVTGAILEKFDIELDEKERRASPCAPRRIRPSIRLT